MVKKVMTKLATLISRVVVDRSSDKGVVPPVQIRRYGSRASVVEAFQPQGLYFRAPIGAEGIMFTPGGVTSNAVLLSAVDRENWPAGGEIADATGGLHYAGAWKVFLDADGLVHLGAQTGDAFIARDDHLQTELDRVKTELDAVKTDLTTLLTAISGAAVAPMDGGAAFKGALVAALAGWPAMAPAAPGATACDNVKGT